MIDTSKGFTLTREFDATPEELWAAWTDPDEVTYWWHPRGLSTPRVSVRIDARVGGAYAYTMIDDATGERYPTAGVYREVTPHERLVFTWGAPAADPDDCPLITVTLTAIGPRTRMIFELRGYDGGPGDDNVYDGWKSALELLGEHRSTEQATAHRVR